MRHLVLAAALMLALTTPAYAYLDPGTGSIVLQGIIGVFAVGAAYVSIFWSRVKSLFSVFGRSSKDASTPSAKAGDR